MPTLTEITLSERARAIKPSPTIAVTNRARELRAAGRDVIGLGAGEPDFDTPEHIKAAALAAIEEGFTKYTAADGTPELKQAVATKFERDNDLAYTAEQIVVSVGAKHSIFNLLMALLNKRDEVIVPAPYWVSYPDMVKLVGAEPVIVGARIQQGFKITPEQLERAITPRTRLLLLNSPCNPSGAVYARAELEALGEVLRRHGDVLVATDDIYEHILWSGEPFCNIVNACPDLYERTVVINGVSKAYAMTGWRIGYAAGPAPVMAAMRKIQSQSTSNPTSISQVAATVALAGDQDCMRPMVAAFKERHDRVVARLNEIDGVRCLDSRGTFYAFPDCSGVIARLDDITDDIGLAEYLLEAAEVALVPGSAFGAEGHLRLSYATDMDTLDRALDRIQRLLSE